MGDQAGSSVGTLRNPQTILANGGCSYNANVYENGQEFHPVLATHGEQKCVKCSCKVRIFVFFLGFCSKIDRKTAFVYEISSKSRLLRNEYFSKCQISKQSEQFCLSSVGRESFELSQMTARGAASLATKRHLHC